ncbi:MAG: PAS domain S-box protein [Deltaproteobacteria bacterium]|nr:PAS domain S-box protein [Deltaproteobacteria bacterium]
MSEKPVRILLMEDDAGQARLFRKRLERDGCVVDHASDGEQGLEMYTPGAYDLVVTDHAMPVYDGLEVIRRLASRGPLPPMIMVTGTGSEQVAVEAMKLGARDYVVKDVDGGFLDLLPAVIDRALLQHRLEDQMRLAAKVFECAGEGIVVLNQAGKIVSVNEAFTGITGYPAEAAIGKNPRDLLESGKHENSFYETIYSSLKQGDKWQGEICSRRQNGEIFTMWLTISAVEDAQGQLNNYVGLFTDITKRKMAEEEVREARDRLTTLIQASPLAIMSMDAEGRLTSWNGAAERIFGWREEEVLGRVPAFVPEEKLDDFFARHHLLLKEGKWDSNAEEEVRRKDGTPLNCNVFTAPIRNRLADIVGAVGIFEDVTARKRAEEALRLSEENLRQSQKLEAIGRLAGGVAHDFNNILMAIIGYCELLHTKFEGRDSRRLEVEEIQKAAERASSLTRQLLAFSRKQIFAPKLIDLNDLVTNLHKMLQRLISEEIKLITKPGGNLGGVMADPGQIEQALINLVVNARDSMPRGGEICIETKNITLDAVYAQKYEDLRPGDYVMISVSDTGSGMDGASLARVFEPFFTTKQLGKGTGLGLSTVHGIVKQSGGHIDVVSEVGRGTTFKIYLPRLSYPTSEHEKAPARPSSKQGTETVLLVEDEDIVRQVARHMLEMNGYTVLEAASGYDALSVSRQAQGPIHLLVTDVVMPGMSGKKAAEILRAQRPGLKVLFMSGHTENAIVHHGVLDPGIAFIQKPFRQKQLTAKVREVLDNQIFHAKSHP